MQNILIHWKNDNQMSFRDFRLLLEIIVLFQLFKLFQITKLKSLI